MTAVVGHVEVCLRSGSLSAAAQVRHAVTTALQTGGPSALASLAIGSEIASLRVCDQNGDALASDTLPSSGAAYSAAPVCVFRMHTDGPSEDYDEHGDGADQSSTFQHWMVPCPEFDGMWESLVYDGSLKQELLDYVRTALLFASAGVSEQLIGCNRVALLHGPPGTGKTSLCKALAHKIAIRFSDRFSSGQLVEINAHSLFSKWFSESGKLVMKLFDKIHELLEDARSFVVVLIDEVESLTAARKAAMSGSEPSDAIRVVNALLTQLDQLRHRRNVLIMTTSNITGAIDVAFIDRADIKVLVSNPSPAAVYKILCSCIDELVRAGLVVSRAPQDADDVLPASFEAASATPGRVARALVMLCGKCVGLSGRALRKLPFVAHAFFVKTSDRVPLSEFLLAMSLAADRESLVRTQIANA